MKIGPVLLSAALSASCVEPTSAPGDPAGPVGSVVLALEAEVCAVYCAAEIRAEIYRDGQSALPLGPAVQGECGEPLAFSALPAGTRVRLEVAVYDEAGALRLEGASEPVTVVAGEESPARIAVSASRPPTITAVSPDPIVAEADAAEVVIAGTDLAGQGTRDGVTLGGGPLAATWEVAWHATVPRGGAAGDLVVTSCGIRSNAWPLRVVGGVVGVAPIVQPPGCAGRRVVGLARSGDAVLVAFACDEGGYVERFGPGACPLDGDAVWELDAPPTAVAPGWVGLEGGGLATFALDASGAVGAIVAIGGAGVVSALAAVGEAVYGVVDGALVRVDEGQRALATLDPGLALVALAASSDAVFALVDSQGDERLVEVGAPGEDVAIRVIPGCAGPRALAAAADHVIVACDDGLVVWQRATGERKYLDEVAGAVVFDPRGDVALAWSPAPAGARLALIDGASGARLHVWSAAPAGSPDAPAALVTLGQRVVAPGPETGSLVVWTPYDGGGPCP